MARPFSASASKGSAGKNLAGNNENLDGIGTMFAYESKSGGSFSERYWRWIKGIPTRGDQVPVLIVTDAPGPGHRARSIVVVDYDSGAIFTANCDDPARTGGGRNGS